MKSFWIHCAGLLLLSCGLGVLIQPIIGAPSLQQPEGISFLIGRAVASVVTPALIVLVVSAIIAKSRSRPINPSKISLWVMWILLFLVSAFGSMVTAVSRA